MSSIPSLFPQFEVLTSIDKAGCFIHGFSSNSTLISFRVTLPFLLSDVHITPSNVSATFAKIDHLKACDLDDIPSIILKKSVSGMHPGIYKLYNKYRAASYFPACEKSTSVVPVEHGQTK